MFTGLVFFFSTLLLPVTHFRVEILLCYTGVLLRIVLLQKLFFVSLKSNTSIIMNSDARRTPKVRRFPKVRLFNYKLVLFFFFFLFQHFPPLVWASRTLAKIFSSVYIFIEFVHKIIESNFRAGRTALRKYNINNGGKIPAVLAGIIIHFFLSVCVYFLP